MNLRWTRPVPRLLLDGAMLLCLVLAFAYWWLGNGMHEALGTVFLLIVLRHVANNLFWWKGMRGGRMTTQRALNLVLGVLLSVTLVILLVSSLAVSRTLAGWLPIPRIFLMQEVHWFAAYWAIALAALHLGVNWNRIAALLRTATRRPWPRWAGLLAWAIGIAGAMQGVASGTLLGFWPRLGFRYSLSMWDFNASVLPFFLHWGAALLTLAVAAQLLLRVVQVPTGLFSGKSRS
ncbi:hypothetical protein LCM08_17835 [Salipiger pacificus]|nr:hypothetical protein [Alloyangia pacifica]